MRSKIFSYNCVYGTDKHQLRVLMFPLRGRRWSSSYSVTSYAVNYASKGKWKTPL